MNIFINKVDFKSNTNFCGPLHKNYCWQYSCGNYYTVITLDINGTNIVRLD